MELDGKPTLQPYILSDGDRRLTESKKRNQSRLQADEPDIRSPGLGACVAACIEQGSIGKEISTRDLGQHSDPNPRSLPWIPVDQSRDSAGVGIADVDRCAASYGKAGAFSSHEMTWTEEMAACRLACERNLRRQQELKREEKANESSRQQEVTDSSNHVDSWSQVHEDRLLSSASQVDAVRSTSGDMKSSSSADRQETVEKPLIDSAYGFSFRGGSVPQAGSAQSDAAAADGPQAQGRGPGRGRGRKGGAQGRSKQLFLPLPSDPQVVHEARGMEAGRPWHPEGEFEYVSPRRAKLLRVSDEVEGEERDAQQAVDSAGPSSRPCEREEVAIVDLPHAEGRLHDEATAAAGIADGAT